MKKIYLSNTVSLLVGFTFLLIIQQAISSSAIVALLLLLCPLLGAILVIYRIKSVTGFFKHIALSVGLIISLIFFSFFNGGKIPGITICFAIIYTQLMCFIARNCKMNIKILKIFFYVSVSVFIYLCFYEQISLTELFQYSSGGLMSSILLAYALFIQGLDYIENRRIDCIMPVFIIILSIYALSRAGFLCSLLYFFLVVCLVFSSLRKIWVKGTFLTIVILFVIMSIPYIIDYLDYSDMMMKIESKGADLDHRDEFWKWYFSNVDFYSFFTGVDYHAHLHSMGFNDNIHNSFIQLHGEIGLLGIFLMIYMIKRVVFFIRKDIILSFFFIILLLRGLADTTYFFTYLDFVVFYYLMVAKISNKRLSLRLTIY